MMIGGVTTTIGRTGKGQNGGQCGGQCGGQIGGRHAAVCGFPCVDKGEVVLVPTVAGDTLFVTPDLTTLDVEVEFTVLGLLLPVNCLNLLSCVASNFEVVCEVPMAPLNVPLPLLVDSRRALPEIVLEPLNDPFLIVVDPLPIRVDPVDLLESPLTVVLAPKFC
jgi:hypothetical protein